MAEKTVLDNNTSSIIKFKDKDGNEFPKWEEKRLGDLFDIFVGGDIDKEHSSIHQTKTYCYPVFANALTDDGLYGYADYYKNIGDTITVTGRGDVGHAVARHCAYVPIVRLLVLVPRYKECVDFFAYQINVTKIFVESTGVPQLTSPQLSKVKMKCPCVDEQEKIASFLMSIDNLISTQESKISILETYNRGLISKIFKQEIRFKDDNGNEFPDWIECKLKDLYIFEYGEGNNNPSNGGQYPVYGANGIIGFYTKYNAEQSIIIGHMGVYAGSVLWEDKKHFVTYNGTITKPKDKEVIIPKYGYYLLLNRKISKICAGSGMPFLAYNTLNNIKVMTTPCLEEQEKIANFLSSLDNVLQEEKNYLEYLKTIKKGLLQQMFV